METMSCRLDCFFVHSSLVEVRVMVMSSVVLFEVL